MKILLTVTTLFYSCNNNNGSSKNDIIDNSDTTFDAEPSLPPGYREHKEQEYCDSLKARTYANIRKGVIQLITDDFPGGIDNRTVFEEMLKKTFKMELLPIFDSVYYSRCKVPVMDSVIASKYGPNGKDSIIRWLNHYVDSVSALEKTIK